MTHSTTSERATAQTGQRPKRLWRGILVSLIIAIVFVAIVSWLQPTPPRFELITADDYHGRTKRFAFIHDTRAQLTRISPKIFGFDPVEISGSYHVIDGDDASDLKKRPLTFSTNAVQVWILASNEVARTEYKLRTDSIARWRIGTSEGVPSVMSMGTPTGRGPGSVEFASHPKVRGGNVDLAAKLTAIVADAEFSAPATNQLAFRMFLKPDEGGIVFDGTGVLFIWAHAP